MTARGSSSIGAWRALAGAALLCASVAQAGPIVEPFEISGSNDTVAVAASAAAGYTVLADTFQDRVEVRDVTSAVVREITRAQILALCPWMTLDGGPDGPAGVASTPTGNQVFILVHDDTTPADGLGSDAILRWNQPSNTLTLHQRLDLFHRGDQTPVHATAHDRAILYVGSTNATGQGLIRAVVANANVGAGSVLATWNVPGPAGAPLRGLTIDRESHTIFVATDAAVYRAPLTNNFGVPPTWTLVTNVSGVRSLAYSDAYGPDAARGLYVLRTSPAAACSIEFVPAALALSGSGVPFFTYASSTATWHALAARGDGRMVIGLDEDAAILRDDADTLPDFAAWQLSEFQQVLAFSRGLVSPDGEPAGWVIDADTTPMQPRFHPATPDGAAWVVLMLIASEQLQNDALSQPQVRTILTRYAGLSPDNIRPSRTLDGIYRHWIDPLTGNAKPGWDPEFATLSTMKIVAAAGAAIRRYPDDPAIVKAASRIIFRVRNWDTYIRVNDRAMYFKGLGVGPDTTSGSRPFHEGLTFIDQAAQYGGASAQSAYSFWLNRAGLPSAAYLTGFPITSNASGAFEAAFVSLYAPLLTPSYRASPDWQTQVRNIRWNNAAWTDDWGPRFFTVFSAGTTRSDWGGYRADNLQTHPGDVTTFPSLMALSAFGDPNPSVGAYHAFRRGARQTFRTGASLLYRRSDIDRTYVPNSAGLPDVALGALALAELRQPGLIDQVLSGPYPRWEQCPTDLTGDGRIGIDDLYAVVVSPSDLNGDGLADATDAQCQGNWLRRNERRQMLQR